MQVIYEGKDITNFVEIKKADFIDNAGGIADSLEVWFDDPEDLWAQWNPRKNDIIVLTHEGLSSGLMYVDELEQRRGNFVIKALSVPQNAKTPNTKTWEDIRFLNIAMELSEKYGFKLETYGLQNHLYKCVNQFEQADFEFLAFRCALEGYMLKITNQKVVIYDERFMENQPAAITIYKSQFDGDYFFRTKSIGIYEACEISYGDIRYKFNPGGISGPVLKINDIYISSHAEAERFTKNLLRYKNKHETTGHFKIKLDSGITAGNNIQVQGAGLANGKYFCEQAVHRFVDKKMSLQVRRPLEGY